jgi:hypothetical protein
VIRSAAARGTLPPSALKVRAPSTRLSPVMANRPKAATGWARSMVKPSRPTNSPKLLSRALLLELVWSLRSMT